MAVPYACSDSRDPPITVRQLKALVLLVAMDAKSSPSNLSIRRIEAIGNPIRFSSENTERTSAATDFATIISPNCSLPQKSMYGIESKDNAPRPGPPSSARQDLPCIDCHVVSSIGHTNGPIALIALAAVVNICGLHKTWVRERVAKLRCYVCMYHTGPPTRSHPARR